ncbi:MAG: ABC transporter permease [Chitinophagaceae bacterium]
MFVIYLKTAIRNFWKHKLFSLINISGLAIGISAALVIYLIVQFEFSFEGFRKDKDRIYRVVTETSFPGGEIFKNSGVSMPLPKAAREELTGIDLATHFMTVWSASVTVPTTDAKGSAPFKNQGGIVYADEFYFLMFEEDWMAGSKENALKEPYQVVLTEERARSYFGDIPFGNILGKTIIYDDSISTIVSGIVKDQEAKATDFRFKEFISLATVMSTNLKDNFGGGEWGSVSSASQFFVKLKAGTKPELLNAQFKHLREKHSKNDDNEKDDSKNSLQPLSNLHFDSEYGSFDSGRQAHKPTLYGLLAVAVFLLLLGCINFINLTTAQSTERAKEVGVKRVLGSGKRGLILQFLGETFMLALLATGASVALLPWLLKIFSDFIPPEINFSSVNQVHVWIFLLLLVFVVTVVSGLYPAVVITRFNPIMVLKNQFSDTTGKGRKTWLRKWLTVTQFTIAQFLVIATLVVGKQISFSLNKELGYKKDAIVYFSLPWSFSSDNPDLRSATLLEKLKSIPEVDMVSLAGASPAHNGTSSSTIKVNNGEKESEVMTEVVQADPSYFEIYQLKLLAGEYLSQSDTVNAYLVNESFTKAFGFKKPEDAVGKFVNLRIKKVPIVGVLKDFHTKSTHEPIKPLAYTNARRNSSTIHLALKSQAGSPGLWKNALQKSESEFRKLYPEETEFKVNFYDETIASFYKKEQDISSLLTWFSGLCIFISCLGLLGLVIFTTNTRKKEIGVRKVLGASVIQIVSLLSKDLISLVLIAFIIASPLAWLAMNRWLDDFAYRTDVAWWVFAVCGIGMLLIALILLGARTVRVAFANPVDSLRTE